MRQWIITATIVSLVALAGCSGSLVDHSSHQSQSSQEQLSQSSHRSVSVQSSQSSQPSQSPQSTRQSAGKGEHRYVVHASNSGERAYSVELYLVRGPIKGVRRTYADGHTETIQNGSQFTGQRNGVVDVEPIGKQRRSTEISLKPGITKRVSWTADDNTTLMYVVRDRGSNRSQLSTGTLGCGSSGSVGTVTIHIRGSGISSATTCRS